MLKIAFGAKLSSSNAVSYCEPTAYWISETPGSSPWRLMETLSKGHYSGNSIALYSLTLKVLFKKTV